MEESGTKYQLAIAALITVLAFSIYVSVLLSTKHSNSEELIETYKQELVSAKELIKSQKDLIKLDNKIIDALKEEQQLLRETHIDQLKALEESHINRLNQVNEKHHEEFKYFKDSISNHVDPNTAVNGLLENVFDGHAPTDSTDREGNEQCD